MSLRRDRSAPAVREFPAFAEPAFGMPPMDPSISPKDAHEMTKRWSPPSFGRIALAGGLVACLLSSCSSGPEPVAPPPVPSRDSGSWEFVSDFEQASTLEELFPANLKGWTTVQCVSADGLQTRTLQGRRLECGSNSISLDSASPFPHKAS